MIDAVNRHTVTAWGWTHEQDNSKVVLRDGTPRELVREHGRGNRKVGLDRASVNLVRALEAQGLDAVDCMQDTLHCRRIKTPEEIAQLQLGAEDLRRRMNLPPLD